MSATLSTMLEIGTKAPDFSLPDTNRNLIALNDLKVENGLVVMFICNHCPFVKHLNTAIVKFANEYSKRGIQCVAISSNDVEKYPQDSPELMKELAEKHHFPFPYLFDETQEIAKSYKAACTPDFFLFDSDYKLFYRGQFDESRPGNDRPIIGDDMRRASDDLLSNNSSTEPQIPSMGCNIKWKQGNEPEYFSL